MGDITTDVAMEVGAVSLGNKMMAGGAFTGAAGWLAQINWVGLTGVAVAVIGLVVSVYFQIKKDRRETKEFEMRELRKQELHEAQMRALRERCEI